MPTRKTTRIPPRTRPPRRRLPSPLARPSHERVQFSESFLPRLKQKLFPQRLFSRNGDTHLDKIGPHGFSLCSDHLYNYLTYYFFTLIRSSFWLLFAFHFFRSLSSLHSARAALLLGFFFDMGLLHAGLATLTFDPSNSSSFTPRTRLFGRDGNEMMGSRG
jgi:hypothetical protein